MKTSAMSSLCSSRPLAVVDAERRAAKSRRWMVWGLLLAGLCQAGTAFAAAELGITAATSNATPTAGGAAFSYTLTVTNNGPDDAFDVIVIDPMPPSVIFQNVSVVNTPSVPGFGLICSGPPVGENGVVNCQGHLPGAAPSSAVITIVAQIVAQTASGVRTNTATVASTTQEANPNINPNSASVQQNIQVDAPLAITLDGPANFVPGQNVVYKLAVTNNGSSNAINATISNPLPAGTTFVSMFGTGPFHDGCTHNAGSPGTLSCTAIDIPSGTHALTIVVKTASDQGSPLDNTAMITTAGTGSIQTGSDSTSATNP